MKTVLLILSLVGYVDYAQAANPPTHQAPQEQETWVEAEGVVAMGQDTTLEAAQRGSLDAARRAAIEQAVGTFVSGSTIIHNNQLADDLVRSMVRGVIVEEKILKRGVSDAQDGQGASYQTNLKAKVRGIPAERRGSFAVKAGLSRTQFNDGDEAQIRVTATQDAYLYIFNVGEDESITVLAPNRYEPETRLQAGGEFVFPTDTLLQQNVRLRTWLLPNTIRSVEKIKVIVTRQPVGLLKGQVSESIFKEYNAKQTALLIDLMRALAALDPADWAETTAVYEVRKP